MKALNIHIYLELTLKMIEIKIINSLELEIVADQGVPLGNQDLVSILCLIIYIISTAE